MRRGLVPVEMEKRKGNEMNVMIITKAEVSSETLDVLSRELPAIIAGVLEVPGGYLALLKPEQISLEFRQASLRDSGADIRLMVFARSNAPRSETEQTLVRNILDRLSATLEAPGRAYSLDVRLYLLEIGAAYREAER